MIPRSQHFRDRAPFPLGRSGILRVLEKAVLERFLSPAGRRAHYAGKQANASIENGDCGGLSARKDNVAQADLFDVPSLENPFVETLEPAAQQGDA